MASSFAKDALKICVAQICQNIGWHAVQASPMDILVDVLQRYMFEIAKSVHQYSTQYNRTEPNLDDLALTFKDFGIVLQEIEEYVNNVEPVPFACKIASFPVKHAANLQHPKPESRELLVRPEHIPGYLPLMRPDLEEEDTFNQQNTVDGAKKTNSESNAGGDSPSPFNSPKHGSRRSADWVPDTPSKKPRYYTEEEGRPMREVTSVFMTAAGFISPIHEGKTAEASLPCLVDSPPPTPEYQSPPHTSVSSKKESKSKDVKKDKSSKSKKDKDTKKDIRKLKSKKEKENKENASKHDKAMTSSSSTSVKKDHSSHKSSKSDKSSKFDDARQKLKSDKAKLKARKVEMHKMKEGLKMIKLKAKMKHTGTSGSSSLKSSKLSSSKKFKSGKVSKPYKNLNSTKQKSEKVKVAQLSPVKTAPPPPHPPLPVPVIPKEPPVEIIKAPVIEPVIEELIMEDLDDDREEFLSFREESPESRLVIDDSLETQAKQERESRLEVIDECIEAVIRRGEEESEVENEKTHRAMDDIINSVVRGPTVKKLEPKDIYDFTDTSDESSLSSCDIPPPHSPVQMPPSKKEKKNPEGKKSDSPKKNKNKEKSKKKREAKVKSPSPYSPPKTQKPQFILRVDDRTPSPPPSLKDDLLSSDGSTPSSSPPHNTFLEHSPTRPGHMHPPSLLSHMSPPIPSSFIPMPGAVSGYSTNPFTPMRPLPTHFPTPPLFVTPSKTESGGSFQNMQPLNLAKSGPSSLKSSPDKSEAPSKTEGSDLIKKAVNLLDKSKSKDHKKEKVKRKGKKEVEKEKAKEKKEEIKEKEKVKPKEKPKPKPEKVKVDKRKSKPEKKKVKEDKIKEDTVPKITMKLSSGTGSTKILVKPNTKNSTPLSSSPSTSDDEEEMLPTPSPPPPRVRSPSPPPRSPTPPPREPTPPPPPTPSPPPPVVKEEKIVTPPVVTPPPVTKSTPSRGRGRGRKAAVPAPLPPARTVITETLGTIVDESGNKIWICPACSGADDGSPMIGCDECDDWYHWVCVGIVVPPKEEEEWFCVRCIAKRQTPKSKKGRKKHKKDK